MSDSKKKYVNDIKVDWSYDDLMADIDIPDKKYNYKDFDQAYLFTQDNRIIQGFLHIHDNKPLVIPEPEPSILYYNNAGRKLSNIIKFREDLLKSIGMEETIEADRLFTEFFMFSSDFVINLFASLEAYNNSVIPEDFTIRIKKRLMNREIIQRFACFDDKVNKVVPQIFEKSFTESFSEKWKIIDSLKSLRDNLIHTKNMSKNWAASYRDIYRDCLSFEFSDAYIFVKDYMNYYKPDWIENIDVE
jgi:hypothetical protein